MALAQIKVLESLIDKIVSAGLLLSKELSKIRSTAKLHVHSRSAGLLAGVELIGNDGRPASGEAMQVVKQLLADGYIVLPEGEHGNVIGITPPLTISAAQIRQSIARLRHVIAAA
jgi:4-aminobutyrate aminotransferase